MFEGKKYFVGVVTFCVLFSVLFVCGSSDGLQVEKNNILAVYQDVINHPPNAPTLVSPANK
jgi:hypothetical protein